MNRSTVRTTRMIRPTRTILAIVGLATLGLALVRFATSATGSPPLLHPRLVDDWWTAGDPLDATAALARLVCLVLVGYLLLVSAVRLMSMHVGWTRLAGATTRLLPRVAVVMTTTLVASTTVAYTATGPSGVRPTTGHGADGSGARMEVVETSGRATSTTTSTSTTSSTVAAATDTGTLATTTVEAPPPLSPPAQIGAVVIAPADSPARTSLPWATAAGERPVEAFDGSGESPEAPTSTLGAADASTYVVKSGDHLWAIAERVVVERLGASPTEAQVATYWSALIELNRDRLVDPANPDLIMVGQEFVLPAE